MCGSYGRVMPADDAPSSTGPQRGLPRPVLLSFHPEVAEGVARGIIPWEYRKRRSGHERGTRVLMYASGKVRAIVGAYTAGTVFEYDSLATLTEGIARAEEKSRSEYVASPEWLTESLYPALPHGFAFEVTQPCAFDPPLELGRTLEGKKVKGPQGFQYLDLSNPDHVRLWEKAQGAEGDFASPIGSPPANASEEEPEDYGSSALSRAVASQAARIEEVFGAEAARTANYGWAQDEKGVATKIYGHGVIETTFDSPDEHTLLPL
jgi:predicted transcriptional regulator